MGLDPTKEYMKLKFIAEDLQETADQMLLPEQRPYEPCVCPIQRFFVPVAHPRLGHSVRASLCSISWMMFRTMCTLAW